MSLKPGIFLSGATGLLGRYLLRDLLASGYPVTVLIRNSPTAQAAERLAALQAFGEESLKRKLPPATMLPGDLRTANLGLGAVERRFLAKNAAAVIHAAAYVSYHPTADGEPWETNVHGTRRLLEMVRSLGVTVFHHLSTAFVCGDRQGVVREDELDCGRGSSNAYEQSKFAAEQLIRRFDGLRTTIYRPSVVIGDSRTGYTSTYHHFYRFLELAVRLSSDRSQKPTGEPRRGRQRLPLRLPLTGEETQNLVPVDWVSRAIVTLLGKAQSHGRTYHLVARKQVRLQEIKQIVEDLLQIEGIEWAGCDGLADPTSLEQLVLEQFQDYWSYLRNDLTFDCRNTRQALKDLPSPTFDRQLVSRLLQFAVADGWGRERCRDTLTSQTGLAHYLEHILPEQVTQSSVAHVLPRGLRFALDIHDCGGGQWTCHCDNCRFDVQRGLDARAEMTFRMDAQTLADLIHGKQTTQQAFFDGRIELLGDMEKALKFAMLIEQFFTEKAQSPARRLRILEGVT